MHPPHNMTRFAKLRQLALSPQATSTAAAISANRAIRSMYAFAIVVLVFLSLWYAWLIVVGASQELHTLSNGIAPLIFIGVQGWMCLRIAQLLPDAIWSPTFWLPASSAVFFGFGPLVEVYGNQVTQASLAAHPLAISPDELSRAHLLSTVGVMLLFAGFWAHMRINASIWQRAVVTDQRSPIIMAPLPFALLLILAGAFLRYGLIKPAEWGMTDLLIAGVITAMNPLIDVGFGILAYIAVGQRTRKARILFITLWPIHFFLASLSLAKFEIILAMVLPALGAFIAHRSLFRLGIAMIIIAFIFVFSQPYVHFGRDIIMERQATISQAKYAERIDILQQYITNPRAEDPEKGARQGSWTRLSYAGPQAFAMAAYDNGYPGSSL